MKKYKVPTLTEAQRYRFLLSWLGDDELLGLVMTVDDPNMKEFKGCNKCVKAMLKKRKA